MREILIALILALTAFQGVELNVVQRVEPVYPALARAARVQRAVKMSVNVSPDGSVQNATVVDGHPLLNEAALEAARQWKFNRTPFGGVTDVTLSFALPVPVTGSITGRVVDPEGRPMEGILISTGRLIYTGGRQALAATLSGGVRTDRSGDYRVSLTEPGEYYVIASYSVPLDAPAGATAENYARQTYYPGTTDAFAAVPVTVHLRSDALLSDIRIPRMNTVRVSGKVVVPPLDQPAKTPVEIRLYRKDGRFADLAVAGEFPRIEDSKTEIPFDLRGLEPGVYELVVSVATGPPHWAYSGRLSIDVRERSVENATVVLHRNIEFRGRVVSRDPAFRPESLLVGVGGNYRPEADGTVRLFNVAEGSHTVAIQGLPENAYVSDLRLGPSSIYADGIVSVTDRPPEDLHIILGANGASIDGTVQGRLQQGVVAQVMLVPEFSRRKNPLFYRSVKSSAAGAFQFGGLAPGEYKLFAFEDPPPPGAMENAEFIAQYEQRGGRVTVREGTAAPGVIVTAIPKP